MREPTPSTTIGWPALLNDKLAAAYLGISRSGLWAGVSAGEIPDPVKHRGRTLWKKAVLDQYVEKL